MFPANIIIIILIDKLNIIVYDNTVTKTKKVNKKTSTAHQKHHQLMGIRRKVFNGYLTTYECRSIG